MAEAIVSSASGLGDTRPGGSPRKRDILDRRARGVGRAVWRGAGCNLFAHRKGSGLAELKRAEGDDPEAILASPKRKPARFAAPHIPQRPKRHASPRPATPVRGSQGGRAGIHSTSAHSDAVAAGLTLWPALLRRMRQTAGRGPISRTHDRWAEPVRVIVRRLAAARWGRVSNASGRGFSNV